MNKYFQFSLRTACLLFVILGLGFVRLAKFFPAPYREVPKITVSQWHFRNGVGPRRIAYEVHFSNGDSEAYVDTEPFGSVDRFIWSRRCQTSNNGTHHQSGECHDLVLQKLSPEELAAWKAAPAQLEKLQKFLRDKNFSEPTTWIYIPDENGHNAGEAKDDWHKTLLLDKDWERLFIQAK